MNTAEYYGHAHWKNTKKLRLLASGATARKFYGILLTTAVNM